MRPAVSVVVPFRGDDGAAGRTAAALRSLRTTPGDELILADNTDAGMAAPALSGVATVVRADREASSYHARNAGADAARSPWLLFLDADCVPQADLLDRFFDPPPAAETGLVGGSIVDHAAHSALLGRYASSRELYSGSDGSSAPMGDYAPTGNLLVRHEAFAAVGGFAEGIRSAGDVDLCWRVQRAGWGLERRPAASVAHRHREDLRSFLSMVARYGAGSAWLEGRYPGSAPRWPLSVRELARAGVDSVRYAVAGRRDEAAFRVVDALGLVAHNVGYGSSNEVPRG